MQPSPGPWPPEHGPNQYGTTPQPGGQQPNHQPAPGYQPYQGAQQYQGAPPYQGAQPGYENQAGYGYPMQYATPRPTNGMAIGALVASLLFAPLGIILGHVALSQIKRTGEEGRGLAISGLVIGYVLTAVALITWIFIISVFNSVQNDLEDDYYSSLGSSTSSVVFSEGPVAPTTFAVIPAGA